MFESFCIFLLAPVFLLLCLCWGKQKFGVNCLNKELVNENVDTTNYQYTEKNNSNYHPHLPASLFHAISKDSSSDLGKTAHDVDLNKQPGVDFNRESLGRAELNITTHLRQENNSYRNCELPPVPVMYSTVETSSDVNSDVYSAHRLTAPSLVSTSPPVDNDVPHQDSDAYYSSLCGDVTTVDSDGFYASVMNFYNQNRTFPALCLPTTPTNRDNTTKVGEDISLRRISPYYGNLFDDDVESGEGGVGEPTNLKANCKLQTTVSQETPFTCAHLYAQVRHNPLAKTSAHIFDDLAHVYDDTSSSSIYLGPPIPDRKYDQSEIDRVNQNRIRLNQQNTTHPSKRSNFLSRLISHPTSSSAVVVLTQTSCSMATDGLVVSACSTKSKLKKSKANAKGRLVPTKKSVDRPFVEYSDYERIDENYLVSALSTKATASNCRAVSNTKMKISNRDYDAFDGSSVHMTSVGLTSTLSTPIRQLDQIGLPTRSYFDELNAFRHMDSELDLTQSKLSLVAGPLSLTNSGVINTVESMVLSCPNDYYSHIHSKPGPMSTVMERSQDDSIQIVPSFHSSSTTEQVTYEDIL